jgi:uncharacterized repeat protein (TIGR03803 family)
MAQPIQRLIKPRRLRCAAARIPAPAVHEALENRRLLSGYTLATAASFAGTDGEHPRSGLIMDSAGNLYGTAPMGGANDGGVIFEIPNGTSSISAVASFNDTTGTNPVGELLMDSDGNLYGTTGSGFGTIFELASGSSVITTLAGFNATDPIDAIDPQLPSGGMVVDANGNLFGTTQRGGTSHFGTVFELAHGTDAITTLFSFTGGNGAHPEGGLIMDSAGNLYGTTTAGGANNDGTVFEVANGSGKIAILANFSGANGINPAGPLLMDPAGNLYGTTSGGGDNNLGAGTVFEVARGSGIVTSLASFNRVNGVNPTGTLAMDSSGNLYGATALDGAFDAGTAFEIASGSDSITTLVNLDGPHGASPLGGLVLGASGNLFGIAAGGGANGDGALFELSPNPAAQLAFTTSPAPASAGAPLAPAITVSVEDASGNIVATDNSTVTLTIASGPAGATLIGDVSAAAVNGVATFNNLSLNRGGTYTLAAADGTLPAVTSSSFAITSNAPPSTIVPTFGRLDLPASVIAGAPLHAVVPVALTNDGSKLHGIYTVNLFVSNDSNNAIRLSTLSRNLSLAPGKHAAFNFTLKPFASTLPAGTYHLLAEVIDPAGGSNMVESPQTIQVIAPIVSLAISAGPVVPATINASQPGTVLITIENTGNVNATGLLDVTLSASIDGITPLAGAALATHVENNAAIRPGKSMTIRLRFKPGTLAAGTYSCYISASLDGAAAATIGSQFTAA